MKGQQGRVFLVADGHPAHKAKLLLKYVASLGGRLELHSLPTYAPDLIETKARHGTHPS